MFYTTKNGKIANDSVRGIAVQDFFYRSAMLTRRDVEVIKGFSRMSPEKLHGAHMSYLGEFLKIQKAENLYRKSGMQNQEVDQCLHALRCSLLENTHASHEKSTLPILDSLAHGKLEVLQDEREMLEFMVFFGHQISRTRTFRDSVIKNQPRRTSGEVELAESIEHAWWFLSYMFGMNL